MNAFTVDLEDWFNASTVFRSPATADWDKCEISIEEPLNFLLELLRENSVRATFFVLGWLAEKRPGFVEKIAAGGHEVASHGYSHKMLNQSNVDEFTRDIELSCEILEKITGIRPAGYRAPVFTITPQTKWALPLLKSQGFKYSSSVFPYGSHPDYGWPGEPLKEYSHENGPREIPLTCAEIAGKRVPCAGGGYFRLLPYSIFRKLFSSAEKNGRPGIFYIHPWELNPELPRVKMRASDRWRQYQNLGKTRGRLERLLDDLEFTSISDLFNIENSDE